MLEKFYKAAIELYGEERIDLIDQSVFILYPKVQIENSVSRQKHELIDLVVVLTITDRLVELKGYRLTITESEYRYRYLHSHIPSSGIQQGDEKILVKKFCSGTFFALFDDYLEREDYLGSLMVLFNFISVESEQGGPYRSLASIGSTSRKRQQPYRRYSADRTINLLADSDVQKYLRVSIVGPRVRVSLTDEIEERLLDSYNYLFIPHYRNAEGERFYIDESRDQLHVPDRLIIGSYNLFKGIGFCKIIKEEKDEEKEIQGTPKFLSKQVKEGLEEGYGRILSQRLYSRRLPALKAEWESKASNTRERIISDKTVMC